MEINNCKKCPFYKPSKHSCSYHRKYIGFNVKIDNIQKCPLNKDKKKILEKLNY